MKNEEILRLLMNGETEGISEEEIQTVTLNLLSAIKGLVSEYIELYEGEISPIKNYDKLIDALLSRNWDCVDLTYIGDYIKNCKRLGVM